MFGKKKRKSQIDKEQLALIQNAQRRIRQKKRFYSHTIVFVIFSLLLFTFNVGLGFKNEIKIATLNWSVIIILIWFVFLFWHFLNVFLFQAFMGAAWEQQQLEKLVSKQQVRIEKIKNEVLHNGKND